MILHVTGLVIRLVFMIALVHFTSAEIVGLFSLAVSIEAVSVYLAGFEFHTFSARRAAKTSFKSKLRILISNHFRLMLITCPLASLVGFVAATYLSFSKDIYSLLLISILVAVGLINQELGRYLILLQKSENSVFLSFLRTAAWQPLAILFLTTDVEQTIRNILQLWLFSSLIALIRGLWILRKYISFFSHNKYYILHGIKESSSYYFVASLSTIQGNAERFILQLILGPSDVGIFSFYQTLSGALNSAVQVSIINIELPNILLKFRQKIRDRFIFLYRVRRRVLYTALFLSLSVSFLVYPILLVVAKSNYLIYIWILPILLAAQIFTLWSQPIHLALYAAKYDELLFKVTSTSFIVLIILNYILINYFGIIGAVFSPLLIGLSLAWVRVNIAKRLRILKKL